MINPYLSMLHFFWGGGRKAHTTAPSTSWEGETSKFRWNCNLVVLLTEPLVLVFGPHEPLELASISYSSMEKLVILGLEHNSHAQPFATGNYCFLPSRGLYLWPFQSAKLTLFLSSLFRNTFAMLVFGYSVIRLRILPKLSGQTAKSWLFDCSSDPSA